MSLLPYIFEDFRRPIRPSRILDQHFGLGLEPEDFMVPFNMPQRLLAGYFRPWRSAAAQQDVGSTVQIDKDKFQVNLDVKHFTPEEITVKVTGDKTITVEAKHEEKEDEHGIISRQFVRKYVLPEGHDIQKIASSLSSDGVLSITAPKLAVEDSGERMILIQQTGVPSKVVQGKKEEKTEKEN